MPSLELGVPRFEISGMPKCPPLDIDRRARIDRRPRDEEGTSNGRRAIRRSTSIVHLLPFSLSIVSFVRIIYIYLFIYLYIISCCSTCCRVAGRRVRGSLTNLNKYSLNITYIYILSIYISIYIYSFKYIYIFILKK